MRYIVMDERNGDLFNTEFNNLEEAVKEADKQWGYLTAREKTERQIYVLESANPDDEAPDHFDGNVVHECR